MPRDVEYPAEVDLPITDTLASLAGTNAGRFPNRAVYAVRTGNNWHDVTAAEFNDQVRAAAKGLVSRGVEAGNPVAILSPTRYEWTVLDFAIWSIGAFAVPIYDSSSAEQIAWIVRDSRAVAVITDSDATAARVREAVSEPPPLWVMEQWMSGSLGK